jgi:molecular chaperone DnaJ
VLSDAEKRGAYDRFGHAGLVGGDFDFSGAGIGDILSHFQDMFSDFFGGFGGTSTGRRRSASRGQDIRVEASISLKDAMLGCKQEVVVRGAAACDTCDGSGAKAGTKPVACTACRGTGQVATQRGFIMFSTTCPTCRGAGEVIKEACESCRGSGYLERQRKVVVSFPAGIDSGQRLRASSARDTISRYAIRSASRRQRSAPRSRSHCRTRARFRCKSCPALKPELYSPFPAKPSRVSIVPGAGTCTW